MMFAVCRFVLLICVSFNSDQRLDASQHYEVAYK